MDLREYSSLSLRYKALEVLTRVSAMPIYV